MPAQFRIRPVEHDDMAAIAGLMQGLGHDHGVDEITRRWRMIEDRAANPALIAQEGGSPIGLIALHIAPLLFYPEPLARITTLVVASGQRRRGVGRALVEAAERLAREAGCDTIELTTGHHRVGAHAFYRSLGFENLALRMERQLMEGD